MNKYLLRALSLNKQYIGQPLDQTMQRLRALAAASKLRAGSGWTAVEAGPHALLAVSIAAPVRKGGRPLVLKAGIVELDPQNGTLTAAALGALAAQVSVPRSPWALLLPRDDYRVIVLPEPAVPAAELGQSVRWQLAPLLDFPIEEATVEHMFIPTLAWQAEKKQELYAIAARLPVMENYADLFHQAHLRLSAIDIYETAQRNIAARLEQSNESLGMISFSEQHVQITFSWQHELYMDRLIAEPIASMTEAPERRTAAYARILLQIQRSIDALRQNFPFIPAGRMLVAGAPPEFAEQLAAAISEPVEILALETLFDFSSTQVLQDPVMAMRYFAVLGAALRGMECTL